MKYFDLPHGDAALAIFPSVPGFGWILFDGPLSAVDWAVSTIAKESGTSDAKNARCLKAIDMLFRRYHPPVVVLEAFEGVKTRRHARIQKLCRSIISLAAVNGASVHVLSRKQIEACFASADPKNRYDVAKVIASYLPEIRRRLPEKRKTWQTENPDMALFAAAALLIVHYANPAEPL